MLLEFPEGKTHRTWVLGVTGHGRPLTPTPEETEAALEPVRTEHGAAQERIQRRPCGERDLLWLL